MGASTLSKLQMEQYKEIVKRFADKRSINLNDVDAVRMAETLAILCHLGYIRKIDINGGNMFTKIGEFKDFDAWHKDRVREERQLSRREWRIAIVSAAIGAFIGLLPTIIPLIISLFTTNG
jgi:hypothetical protein